MYARAVIRGGHGGSEFGGSERLGAHALVGLQGGHRVAPFYLLGLVPTPKGCQADTVVLRIRLLQESEFRNLPTHIEELMESAACGPEFMCQALSAVKSEQVGSGG